MNLHEHQAAEIFERYGVPVNHGEVAFTPDEVAQIFDTVDSPVVIKAQVLTGGRGKAGGVSLARSAGEARAAAERIIGLDIRGHIVRKVLVAPAVDIAQE